MKTPIRVLVGEHDPLGSQAAIENLGRAFPNVEATAVGSRDAFLDAIEFNDYDVVIADNQLPGFKGLEIIDAMNERSIKAPVIFLAEPGEEKTLADAIRRGISDHIIKTFNYLDLIPPVVENALRKKSESEVKRYVECELRNSEERFRTLLDETKEAISVVQQGRFVHVNPAFCRLVKSKNKNEIIGASLEEYTDPGDFAVIQECTRRMATVWTGKESRKVKIKQCDGKENFATVYISHFDYKGRSALKILWRPMDENGSDLELKKALQKLTGIIEDANEIIMSNDVSEFAPKLLDSLAKNLSVSGGSIYLKENECLKLLKTLDNPHQPKRINFPLVPGSVFDKVFEDGRPVFIHNLKKGGQVNRSGWKGYQDDSLMIISLQDGKNNIKGLVSLHNKLEPPFTQIDLQLGRLSASYGLAAMKNHELLTSLKEKESTEKTLHQESLAGTAVIQEGKLVFANSKMALILGYKEEEAFELCGLPYHLFIPPEDREKMAEQLKLLFEYQPMSSRSEICLFNKERKKVWVEVLATQIAHCGKPAVKCDFIDTSKWKKTEEVRHLQSQIIRQLYDWVTITNTEGKISYVSPSVKEVMGIDPKDAIGKTPDDAYGRCVPHENTSLELLKAGGGRGMVSHQAKDGCKTYTKVKTEKLYLEDGKEVGIVSVAKNVTREEELEAQLMQSQKTEAIGSLAGGLAHDFNKLLTGITGYIQIALMNANPDAEVYSNLQHINQAVKSSTALTRQLLAFSRKQVIDPEIINLNDVVASMKVMLDGLLGSHIELDTITRKIEPIRVVTVQVEQILLNLAVNARDAMPNGGKLTIETDCVVLNEEYCKSHPYVTPGDYVMLAVSDTGQGIDKNIQERIFEPFFTTKPKEQGSGLGLSTVYGIVKQHRGSVEVESSPGHGAVFKVYFQCLQEEKKAEKKEVQADTMPRGNETILIVEDEEIVRRMNNDILQKLGYNVITARNGREALRIASEKTRHIDLIMTDVVMPGMNGREVHRRVEESCPGVKVMFTSGYSENTIVHHNLLDQSDNFIGKPYTPPELATKVRLALDREKEK